MRNVSLLLFLILLGSAGCNKDNIITFNGDSAEENFNENFAALDPPPIVLISEVDDFVLAFAKVFNSIAEIDSADYDFFNNTDIDSFDLTTFLSISGLSTQNILDITSGLLALNTYELSDSQLTSIINERLIYAVDNELINIDAFITKFSTGDFEIRKPCWQYALETIGETAALTASAIAMTGPGAIVVGGWALYRWISAGVHLYNNGPSGNC